MKINQYIKILSFIILSTINIKYAYTINTINITKSHFSPVKIAIHDIKIDKNTNPKVGEQLKDILIANLTNSNAFKIIDKKAFIEENLEISATPSFHTWALLDVKLLFNASVVQSSENKIKITYMLWDIILAKAIVKNDIEFSQEILRNTAHKISNSIYKIATGYEGYFNSKIVYIAETGNYTNRIKRIAIMDQDGANHKYLTDGSSTVLTPRFSPDGKKILYLSYKNKIPKIYLMDIETLDTTLIGKFTGMSFAPRFSPDGTKALLSIAKNGATNIYEINLNTKKILQLTFDKNINTSPCYSPDGNSIIFNSNRNGTRQLFIIDRIHSRIIQITSGPGSYLEPNWSKMNKIVFTKISKTYGFTIGVINPEHYKTNLSERLITSGYIVENPCWSANGRTILFTKGNKITNLDKQKMQNKSIKNLNKIYAIDFTGHYERIIHTPVDASDPDWSNNID
ncbi:TolB family protein [Rickettsia endosymbiont of Cardiosporidium cionae]|uniref:TolB family protein n=1 Tax=Rickettsia endosymbiont of Cardiosporidium cionae TaxID=2777155 RepID=UPI0018959714|nr:TolB family protein [Rickettsia endosymbiont of Cardiosporidium cionae]KAF8818413.1 Tol-Pal system protein TolB [Rickettsia endosymbiont of Cardiosporidium cionae]